MEGDGDSLTLGGDYYLGGYPSAEAPFYGMAGTANFSGCVKDVFLGQDTADLESYSESVNVKNECTMEVRGKRGYCTRN